MPLAIGLVYYKSIPQFHNRPSVFIARQHSAHTRKYVCLSDCPSVCLCVRY